MVQSFKLLRLFPPNFVIWQISGHSGESDAAELFTYQPSSLELLIAAFLDHPLQRTLNQFVTSSGPPGSQSMGKI